MVVSTPALSKVHPKWLQLFPEEFQQAAELLEKITDYTPTSSTVFRVFELPPEQVRVVLVGQDPYPTPGDAIGLAFAVNRSSKLPKSLQNLFKELSNDLGISRAQGDLSDWQAQGVFLINRVLTVPIGKSAGHRNIGWEKFTETIIKYLANQGAVGLLLGQSAQDLAPYFKKKVLAPHPSPLSAHRGFFGSKIFSSVNALLEEPIKW